MYNPFRFVPFNSGSDYKFDYPSSVTSVTVKTLSVNAQRGVLLRAARGAGLACDEWGGIKNARVLVKRGNLLPELVCFHKDSPVFICGKIFLKNSNREEIKNLFKRALGSRIKRIQLQKKVGISDYCTFGRKKRKGRKSPGEGITAVVFRNLFKDMDHPHASGKYFACGAFQLASSLASKGNRVIIVEGQLDKEKIFTNLDGLSEVIRKNKPELICLTLLEACAEETAIFVEWIKKAFPGIFVAIGGPMATITPEHSALHISEADFIVRGDGDDVICDIADLCEEINSEGRVSEVIEKKILSLRGLFYFAPNLLITGSPGLINIKENLDFSPFDVSFLNKENIEGGISIETVKGCIHPCTFCVTGSRGKMRRRTARGIQMRLRAYRERIDEIYGGNAPDSVKRIHFVDDDFLCSGENAIEILNEVYSNGFFISSFQASIRDFYKVEMGNWKIDEKIISAIRSEIFQDYPAFLEMTKTMVVGKRPISIESFIKLGIESFCDSELRRLGKGYKVPQIEEIIDLLSKNKIVIDAYFIFCNRRTNINDVVTSFVNISRLKIQHPWTFYIRFPIVPYLVTTYPSPAFRIWLQELKRGEDNEKIGSIEIEKILRAPGFSEYDYPVFRRDLPSDPAVRMVAEKINKIFEPDGLYIKPLENLREAILEMVPSIEKESGELSSVASDARVAARRLDRAGKLIIFEGIKMARDGRLSREKGRRFNDAARILGKPEDIVMELKNSMESGDPRLVLIPTRDCSLRCRYCPMIKEEGKLMSYEIAIKSIEFLLSSYKNSLILQFFGGEALLRRDFVLEVMDAAMRMAKRFDKHIGFILSTNGVSLDENLIEILSSLPVKIEVSIDGPKHIQSKYRVGKTPDIDSYEMIKKITPALISSGIPHDAIMVVHPDTAGELAGSFAHVFELGYRRIQVNPALGVFWGQEEMEKFAKGLYEIEKVFFHKSIRPDGLEFIDLWSYRTPVLLNCEITVDYDGKIYYGNGFLVKTSVRGAFDAGNINEFIGFDACFLNRPDNNYLLRNTYPPDVTMNNIQVGRIMGSFVKHIKERFPDDFVKMKSVKAPPPPIHRW